MGTGQHLSICAVRAAQKKRNRRLPLRACLRKGCRRKFRPNRANQRYCQRTDCLHSVRRWQAAKRQQRRRAQAQQRRAHAAAERSRRQKRKAQAALQSGPASPNRKSTSAWSRRRKKSSEPFCDRPGCWQSTQLIAGQNCSYCCLACRQSMQRVLDRERKARQRKGFYGRFKRQLEYSHARTKSEPPLCESKPVGVRHPVPSDGSNQKLRSYPIDGAQPGAYVPPVPKRGGWP